MHINLKLCFIHLKVLIIIIGFIIGLVACDSSSNDPVTTTDPISTTSGNIVQLDDIQSINKSIDLILYYPDDTISHVVWQQITGQTVTLLAKTSKVASFTPSHAGEYGFSVSFILNNTTKTLEKNITVTEDKNKITARLSHAALTGNSVSFRSEMNNDILSNTLVWQQSGGPKVILTTDNSDGEATIFFDAPFVNVDTLITFEVSATDTDNMAHTDQVGVLIEAAPPIKSNAYFSDRKARVFVYNPKSPYAEDLITCIYSNTLTSSCTLAQTPLLAEESTDASTTPSIKSIMDRVVVSHQWMGDRFKAFLENNDLNNDIKNLLRATTAIVIAYDVRPSFYWPATGAIYLDAENLWLTPDERDTINEAPDFRADFGNDLQFIMPWRYVKNNAYASKGYSKSVRVERTSNDALYRLSALLYHELAHANDFFPSNEWYSHNNNQRVLDAAVSNSTESDALAISLPLASQEMRDVGQVSFAGESANQTQKNYLPADIEAFFTPDRASDFYAYSSVREDYAMLFEELMMQSRFTVMRDVAITNQPTGSNILASDYIVTWGQRGRIGDNKLKDRVIFTASRVLPEFNSEAAINLIPAPIEMVTGNNWIENLAISPNESRLSNSTKSLNIMSTKDALNTLTPQNIEAVSDNYRYYQKSLPTH